MRSQLTDATEVLQIWVAPGGGSSMKNRDTKSICSTCYHAITEAEVICPSCGARSTALNRGFVVRLTLAAFWAFNLAMAAWWWNTKAVPSGSGVEALPDKSGWMHIGPWYIFAFWLLGSLVLGLLAYRARNRANRAVNSA